MTRGRFVGLIGLAAWSGGCGVLLGLDEYTPDLCIDGARSEGEPDIDCGGLCPACADGRGCFVGTDCESQVCVGGTCRKPECSDTVKNGDETDVDCGGACSATCGAGKACSGAGDCRSGVCEGGVCSPTCSDAEQNASESDVDCGGATTCDRCDNERTCAAPTDCKSGVCKGLCKPSHVWSKRFGDAGGNSFPSSVVVASDGDIYLTGVFATKLTFGNPPLTTGGDKDMFIVKLDPSGTHTWSRAVGDDGSSDSFSFSTVDDVDNLIVTGGLGSSKLNFGNGDLTSAGGTDVFVAKIAPNGWPVWSKNFGDAADQFGFGVAAHGQDTIVAGLLEGSINFGSQPATNLTSKGAYDLFVAKLDGLGSHLWSKSFGDMADQGFLVSVAADKDGNVLLAGTLVGAMDFGGGALTSADDDIFVVKLDIDGNHVFSKQFGQTGIQRGAGVRTDASGNVIVTGLFQGTVDFGGGPLDAAPDPAASIFLAKFDPTGAHLWSKAFAVEDYEGLALSVDSAGGVILAGPLYGTINLGGALLTSAGGSDVFLAKFAPTGEHLFSQRFGNESSQILDDIGVLAAAAGPEHALIATTSSGVLDFGGGPLESISNDDIFIAKLLLP